MLLIFINRFLAKLNRLWRNYSRAIEFYKQVKNLCDREYLFSEKLKSYKNLSICYSALSKFPLSLLYLKKMVQVAWYLKDLDKELRAFDLMGLQYFHLGDMDKAVYYHQRFISVESEPENSDMRKLGVRKL